VNETSKDKKTAPAATNSDSRKPEVVIRSGGIAASVWLKQSSTGFYYYDYTLSRSWKSVATGKTGYAQSFFNDHQAQLLEVIQRTSAWIEEKLAAATTTEIDTSRQAA